MRKEVSHVLAVRLNPFDWSDTPEIVIGKVFGLSTNTALTWVITRQFSIPYHDNSDLMIIPYPHSREYVILRIGEDNVLGCFAVSTIATWWARASLFHLKPDICPRIKHPTDVEVKFYHPKDTISEVMAKPPLIMSKWVIKFPKPDEGTAILILIPQTDGLLATPTKDSLLSAHYYLTGQTRIRIEDQVEKQLGKGEAARRILSAFAPDYES